MYKSRIKKTAGSLTVAVDSQNGELLSLVDENSGDNLIKNSSYTLPNPFALTIGGLTLTAPSNTEIKKNHAPWADRRPWRTPSHGCRGRERP